MLLGCLVALLCLLGCVVGCCDCLFTYLIVGCALYLLFSWVALQLLVGGLLHLVGVWFSILFVYLV